MIVLWIFLLLVGLGLVWFSGVLYGVRHARAIKSTRIKSDGRR